MIAHRRSSMTAEISTGAKPGTVSAAPANCTGENAVLLTHTGLALLLVWDASGGPFRNKS